MKSWLSIGLLALIALLFTWTATTLMGKADSQDVRELNTVLREMAADVAEIRTVVRYYMDREVDDGRDDAVRPGR